MMLNRRGFLTGLIAAPAIVHAGNLMPVKTVKATNWREVAYWNPCWQIKPCSWHIGYVNMDPEMLKLLLERQLQAHIEMNAYMENCLPLKG
jgi:hypothetical protein